MKCYALYSRESRTTTMIGWAAERDGPFVSYGQNDWDGWVPADDLRYEVGGNTWNATGALTEDSVEELRKFWIIVGSAAPLTHCNVLGELHTRPWVEAVVSQTFVDVMRELDDSVFSFVQHDKVWDRRRSCPPWDGPFYIASVIPLRKSYDLSQSKIVRKTNRAPRFEGSYGSYGARRVVLKSEMETTPIWRDAYTREVLCTEAGKAAFERVAAQEWGFKELEVV